MLYQNRCETLNSHSPGRSAVQCERYIWEKTWAYQTYSSHYTVSNYFVFKEALETV